MQATFVRPLHLSYAFKMMGPTGAAVVGATGTHAHSGHRKQRENFQGLNKLFDSLPAGQSPIGRH